MDYTEPRPCFPMLSLLLVLGHVVINASFRIEKIHSNQNDIKFIWFHTSWFREQLFTSIPFLCPCKHSMQYILMNWCWIIARTHEQLCLQHCSKAVQISYAWMSWFCWFKFHCLKHYFFHFVMTSVSMLALVNVFHCECPFFFCMT